MCRSEKVFQKKLEPILTQLIPEKLTDSELSGVLLEDSNNHQLRNFIIFTIRLHVKFQGLLEMSFKLKLGSLVSSRLHNYTSEYKAQGPMLCPTEGRAAGFVFACIDTQAS